MANDTAIIAANDEHIELIKQLIKNNKPSKMEYGASNGYFNYKLIYKNSHTTVTIVYGSMQNVTAEIQVDCKQTIDVRFENADSVILSNLIVKAYNNNMTPHAKAELALREFLK